MVQSMTLISGTMQGLYFDDSDFDQYFEFSKSTSWDDIIPDQYGGMTESGLYAQWLHIVSKHGMRA